MTRSEQGSAVGRVAGLWVYPVKSFGGEARAELQLDARGVVADRVWALVHEDGKIASGKTTRRFRRVPDLLRHDARLDGDGPPVLHLGDGRVAPLTDVLAEELAGPGWRFAREDTTPHFDAAAVHLVTTASLADLGAFADALVEPERLRPNLVVDAGTAREEEWAGRRLVVGDAELEITVPTERCVMVGHARRELPRRPRLLRTICRWNDLCAGMYAAVVRPGLIRIGDAVRLV